MTTPANKATILDGAPVAMPVYLVDQTGAPFNSTNTLPTPASAGGTSQTDDATFTAGTTAFTPVGGVYNDAIATATSGHTDAARITQFRAVHVNLRDASGNQLLGSKTSANSTSVVIASDQGAVPIGVTAGTAIDANAGTIGANTLRTVSGGAATGTKSNVVSSATSVTILASNTARKGAIIYNDSTQILYLDLSGGTASNASYSVQVPSQGYFEVPGPNIYNGAITGIWSSANGNGRITEFS